jgi:hypothetical protein
MLNQYHSYSHFTIHIIFVQNIRFHYIRLILKFNNSNYYYYFQFINHSYFLILQDRLLYHFFIGMVHLIKINHLLNHQNYLTNYYLYSNHFFLRNHIKNYLKIIIPWQHQQFLHFIVLIILLAVLNFQIIALNHLTLRLHQYLIIIFVFFFFPKELISNLFLLAYQQLIYILNRLNFLRVFVNSY